jgi:alpha-tubulin suppressor-like RCC1 family protein
MAWFLGSRAVGLILVFAPLAACNDLVAVEGPYAEPGVWTGLNHTCGQDDALEFRCWGANGSARAGQDPAEVDIHTPRPVPGVRGVLQAALGAAHTCVLDPDGRVRCWGANDVGQLGRGAAGPPTPRPEYVAGLRDVVELASDGDFTCARHDDAAISCWGRNDEGQLGRGSASTFEASAGRVAGEWRAVKLSVGRDRTCALDTAGVVRCWGMIATGLRAAVPTVIADLPADIVDVSAAFANCCAITSAGAPWCWGPRSAITSGPFVYPVEDVRVDAVDAGHQRSCGIDDHGAVYCWWNNYLDYMGGPEVLPLPDRATVLAKADYHGCALLVDGTMWCWGANSAGQLGDGSTVHRDEAVRVRWQDE